MTTTPRTLTQMQNCASAYEVSVTAHGNTISLGFTERKTRRVLLHMAQANGAAVLAQLGGWDGDATYSNALGWTFGPARIHFTGRTERDVAREMNRI